MAAPLNHPIRDYQENTSAFLEHLSKTVQGFLKREIKPADQNNLEQALYLIEKTVKVFHDTAKQYGELEANRRAGNLAQLKQTYEVILKYKEKDLNQAHEEFNLLMQQADLLKVNLEGIALAQQKVLPFNRREVFLKGIHPQFEGRRDLLDQMAQEFAFHRPIILYGPPGVGKSETAVTYGNEQIAKGTHGVVWTIHCATKRQMHLSYRQLLEALNLPLLDNDTDDSVRKRVHKRLCELEKPCLLIYDNLDNSIEFPERNVHCLITTRDKAPFVNYNPIEVLPFSPDEALSFVKKTTNQPESPEMVNLINHFGRYPIILAHIANHIRITPGVSIASFMQRMKNFDLLSLPSNERYEFGFKCVLNETFKKIPFHALEWLEICAHISPDHIPKAYLETWVESRSKNSTEKERKCLEVIAILANRGFLRFDLTSQTFSIHRLFQSILKKDLNYPKAVKLLHDVTETIDFSLSKKWKENKTATDVWSTHSSFIFSDPQFRDVEDRQKVVLFEVNALWLKSKARYNESYDEFNKAFAIVEKTFGPDSSQAAKFNNYIGYALFYKAQYVDSFAKCKKAYDIWERMMRHNRKDQAEAANNMGHSLFSQGKLEEAKSQYEIALQFWKETCEPFDPLIARAINNIGNLLFTQGKNEEAAAKYREALQNWEKSLDENHPLLAVVNNNLGHCLKSQKQYGSAQEKFAKALVIWESSQGPNHADVAIALENMGCNLIDQKNYADAWAKLEKALIIREAAFGANHPSVASCLNNMGYYYTAKGEHQNARPLYQRAYDIVRVALGDHHATTQNYLRNLNISKTK